MNKNERAAGFYWVRDRSGIYEDDPFTVARWDAENQWWDAIGYIECRPDDTFVVVSGPISPPVTEGSR